jgi:hypothetical protein
MINIHFFFIRASVNSQYQLKIHSVHLDVIVIEYPLRLFKFHWLIIFNLPIGSPLYWHLPRLRLPCPFIENMHCSKVIC